MTIAPERPAQIADVSESEDGLLATADDLWEMLPGHRVEIVGGLLIVTPPAAGPHGEGLAYINGKLFIAGLHHGETRLLQAPGVWLDRKTDYTVPDFAVADADYREHLITRNCYAPSVYRMVVEVTSSNRATDLVEKRESYAVAGIPVYLIVDRKKEVVLLLTDPRGDDYQSEIVYERGKTVRLPESVGAAVEIDVDLALAIESGE